MLKGLYRAWNAVRPAWPSAVVAALVLVLYAFTPQMIEVFRLEAMRLLSGDPRQWLTLIPSWFGLVLLGSTLYACSVFALFQRYSFTERASPSAGLRLWTARLIGGTTSFGLLGTFLLQASEFGAPAWAGAAALSTVCLLYTLTARPMEKWMLEPADEPGRTLRLGPGGGQVLLILSVVLAASTVTVMLLPLQAAAVLGPIGSASVGLAVWGFLAALFVVAVNRANLPPAILFVALAMGLFGLFNDNHEVRTVPDATYAKPVTVDEHAARWVADRLQADPALTELSPTVVLAEGGGIRAAYFTAAVLADLHERTDGRSTADLFAISGVSGGGVGAVTFMGAVADQREGRDCDGLGVLGRVRRTLSRDLLSPGIVGLLFFDTPQKFVPVGVFPDRAAVFEDSLIEKAACPGEDERVLARPLDELLDRASVEGAAGPALAFSVTATDTGSLRVISNVSGARPLNALDFTDRPISAAGGAYLGARFPLIAPSGWLPGSGRTPTRYVDGGYNDMSGAVAAREFVLAAGRLDAVLAEVAENGCRPTAAYDALRATDITKARLAVALFRPDGACRRVAIRPVVLNLMARHIEEADLTPSATAAPAAVAADALSAGKEAAAETFRLPEPTGRPFEEFLAPVETLFAARHQRRWDVSELLCRYNAPEPDACVELRRDRFRRADSSSPEEVARRKALFERTRWLELYLDHGARPPSYAAVSYSGALEHVPLGWYLGGLNGYVDARATAESRLAVQVLAPAAPPPAQPLTPR